MSAWLRTVVDDRAISGFCYICDEYFPFSLVTFMVFKFLIIFRFMHYSGYVHVLLVVNRYIYRCQINDFHIESNSTFFGKFGKCLGFILYSVQHCLSKLHHIG